LSRDEAMAHISDVMLGASLDLLPVTADLPHLMCGIQPAHLQYNKNDAIPEAQQRAQLCAAAFGSITNESNL
jgi:protein-arginine kinase